MAPPDPLTPIVTEKPTDQPPPAQRNRVLEAIALFKFSKALLLFTVWLGAREILRQDVADQARQWVGAISFASEPRFIRSLLAAASGISDTRLRQLAIIAFAYAVLYSIEGVGLWLERRWAEYLVVVATGSSVPWEIYELARGISGPKLVAFTLNVTVVAYLVLIRRRNGKNHRAAA